MAVNGGKLPGPPPTGSGPDDQQQQANQQPVENIGNVGDVQASRDAEPLTKKYDADKYHDWVRSITNFSFLGIFAVTIILSFCAAIWRGSDWPNVKDLLQLLLPAETALLGSAVGFYFGSQVNTPGR